MNSYCVVQFITLFFYAILIAVVLRNKHAKLKKLFLVYLIASFGWSFVSFMGNLDQAPEPKLFWSRLIALVASWSVISYSHFIAAFTRKGAKLVPTAGYVYLLVVLVLTVLGYMHRNFDGVSGDPILANDYGGWLYFLTFSGAIFIGTSIFILVKSYRDSRNPEHRNRIAYLLTGIGLLVVFGAIWEAVPAQKYSVDHIGHLGNALLITYTIVRFQLLDIKLIVRKSLVYAGISVFITGACLLMIYNYNHLFQGWSNTARLMPAILMVIIVGYLFNPVRGWFEKAANKLFYGKTYDYRQMVRSFANRMSNVIKLEELAEAMLQPITNAVSASQACLLFTGDEYFTARFAERMEKGSPVIPVSIRKDSPIIDWISREDGPLSREDLIFKPEFKGMWQEERESLEAADVELLCPIKSKHRLIAILVLSKKQPRGCYSKDDIDLLMTLAHEAAVVIENAELYEQAKQRANTDELTDLFNHRYFHQRLEEEIARASRFGKIFSLIFLDMDFFKTYNDVVGHLAGDDILKQVGHNIKILVRDTDICFRYGGDEFAVILPETILKDGRSVAERIRRRLESSMDLQGVTLTCSIGIASWPTDGVMREEIIQAADSALYYAKNTGKNRVCVACETALSEVQRIGTGLNPKNSEAILSTIYALAATVDAKDHYTYGHSKKVSKFATDIAEALGYSKDAIDRIRVAALLHDIGKIGISDRLLKKTESLTPEELDLIKTHPNLGVAIIKHIDSLKDCLAAVQYHHEYYNGNGYPSGLKGDNIPLDARILSVADAFDAMTSERPYRERKPPEEAIEELIKCAGTQFDPSIVKVFVELIGKSSGKIVKLSEHLVSRPQ